MDAKGFFIAPAKFDETDMLHISVREPHLTIARKLPTLAIWKGCMEYEHQHFHGRFIADHTLLLKPEPAGKHLLLLKKFMSMNPHTQHRQVF